MKRILAALLAAVMLTLGFGVIAEAPTAEPMETPEATAEPETTEEPTATEEPEPTPEPGRLAGLTIGIDPGHQEHANNEKETIAPDSKEKKPKVSSGTSGVSTRIPEYITVLEISFKLRDALKAEGAEVYMTRESHDVNKSNQERAKMMNELGCDLVLRIHCDGSDGRKANGIGLFVNKSYPISEESRKAAEAILPRMVEATGAKRRDVYQRDTYTGLNWSEVPCILVECGFMSNPEEDERLNDPEYQQKLAEGMVEGICDYFGR